MKRLTVVLVCLFCLQIPSHLAAQALKAGPDFDGDGVVDFSDYFIFSPGYGAVKGDAKFDPGRDLNNDGRVDGIDFLLLTRNFGKTKPDITLTPFTSPGPNAQATFLAALDGTTGIQAGMKLALTISVTGVNGVTGYIAEVLYDSTALTVDQTESKVNFTQLSTMNAGATGFNRRTEIVGSQLPPNQLTGVTGKADIGIFWLTARPGFTKTNIGIRRLVLVSGSKIDTLTTSPSPLVIKINQSGSVAIPKSLDFDGDGGVDFDDFIAFSWHFGDIGAGSQYDLNSNGRVDAIDFFILAQNFGKKEYEPGSVSPLAPPTSPGPNSGAKIVGKLDKVVNDKREDRFVLTISATGVNGLTGYVAEVLYDSTAVYDPITANRLRADAIKLTQVEETATTVIGFNRRTETPGCQLPYSPFSGDTDIATFEFATRPGFTTANIGFRRLILVAGSKIDTLTASPLLVFLINPTPLLGPFVPSLTFDSTKVGSTSQKTFTLSNKGSGNLLITGITVAGTGAAQFKASPTAATVAPGDSQVVTVIFTPTSKTSSAMLSIAHNAAESPATVALTGTGVLARLPSDFNGDGEVNFDDFFLFAAAFGQAATGDNVKFDLAPNGQIDFDDFFAFAASFGTKAGKPPVFHPLGWKG